VAWISPYKAARVVVIQLGHGREAHLDANYRRLVRNAIVWAGGR
jgi:type 1 glutamine amidotransferase